MAGGQTMKNESGEKIKTSNLTFHETGIGHWTEQDLARSLHEGINKNNAVLRPPMPMYPELNTGEIAAIYVYLKTISPTNNKVARKEPMGTKLYVKYACQSCHGETGIGAADLRQASRKYTDEQLKAYISNPKSFGNEKMPVYSKVIKKEDYTALIAYVKQLGESSHK
jgi:mono/diheme cytochrome c family protein